MKKLPTFKVPIEKKSWDFDIFFLRLSGPDGQLCDRVVSRSRYPLVISYHGEGRLAHLIRLIELETYPEVLSNVGNSFLLLRV